MKLDPDLSCGLVLVGDMVIGIPIDQLSEVCHVEKLSSLPFDSDLLLGGFDLRQSIVPVLNFHKIIGLPCNSDVRTLMVVLKNQGRLAAFYIDEVMGMTHAEQGKIQTLQGKSDPGNSCLQAMFAHGGNFVSILDVPALYNLPGVYSSTPSESTKDREYEATSVPTLIFEAGEALFSVPAVEVHAAVPSQSIHRSAIAAGPCLGEISYYGRRIPVMCPVQTLGLGKPREIEMSQIVVLAFPDDRLLGFAVDAVLNIQSLPRQQATRLPAFLNTNSFVGEVHNQEDGRQIYALDVDVMRSHADITPFASFSDTPPNGAAITSVANAVDARANIVHEQVKYLIVSAGGRMAIPLTEISCILEPTDNITPATEVARGFCGFFPRLAHSVALFDLPRMLGKSAIPRDGGRIVLTGDKENQVGFRVEQVLGIEMSEWRETAQANPDTRPVVKITSKEENFVLPMLSLEELVATSRGTFAV
ncbi:MAG: chemotaxis protein CheW [Sulfitobacter sp.]|nr:chemotaxis protein CheW [Sulfitobacter sp.]